MKLMGLAVVGAIVALLLMLLSLRLLLILTMIVATVVVGLLTYYFGIGNAPWLAYFMAIAVFGRYVLQILLAKPVALRHSRPLFFNLILAFLVFLLITTIANFPGPIQLAVGLKIYFPMWLMMFVVVTMPATDELFRMLEKGAVALSLLQFPFVVQQHFFPSGSVARSFLNWDAVVGTFGGDPDGSGASSVLMLYVIVGILVTIEMYQSGRLRFPFAAGILVVNVATLGLGEVKAVFILLPLAIVVQQWAVMRRRPMQFIFGLCLMVGVVYGLFQVYESLYWSQSSGRVVAAGERISRSFSYFFDLTGVNFLTGEVSRGASLALWWNDYQSDFVERLLGYGAGASRSQSTVAIGAVGARYTPLDIAATALAQLLWEVGLIGTTLFVSALFSSIHHAAVSARNATDFVERGRLQTVAAILSVLTAFLIYNRTVVDVAAVQILLATLFGVLIVSARRFPQRRTKLTGFVPIIRLTGSSSAGENAGRS